MSAISCSGGNKNNTPKETTAAEESTEQTTVLEADIEPMDPALEALDYGGATVTILSKYGKTDTVVESTSTTDPDDALYNGGFTVEELTNEPVNDAIYNRNLAVCEALNVEITELGGNVTDLLRRDISSGDGCYDIVANSVFDSTAYILDGYYYNLLDNGIDTYLDTTKPWWSQKWIGEAMMGDRLYCITGSISLTLKKLLYVNYYNKSLGDANGIENLYDVVNEGRWTIDYQSEIISKLYKDLNGNSTLDNEDSFGLLINGYECVDMFWSAFDLDYFGKDNDNWFVENINQEKLVSAIEKVTDIIYNNNGTFDFKGTAEFPLACKMFAQGQSLIAAIHLRWAETQAMRNMTDDYGILPLPKFDENQQNYYTFAHDQYDIMMVPITAKDSEMSGAVLEAMAYESYRFVDPAYFNVALKGRYANDPETRKMLDIIMEGFTVDASWIYGKMFGEPAAMIFRCVVNGGNNFASTYAKYARSIPAGFREIKEKIEKLDY